MGGKLDIPWELRSQPSEDSGSETADRYAFQYQVIARHCCEFDASDLKWLLCEWHTDYVLALSGERYILVSVKHREPNQGNWTLNRLYDDGGLKTLCDRWRDCRKPQQCRLATNGVLDKEAKSLADACASGNSGIIVDFAQTNYAKLGCADPGEAEEFLRSLRIEEDLPSRKYIRAHNIENFVRPMLRRTKGALLDAGKAYDAILEIIWLASRAFGTATTPSTWQLSRIDAFDSHVLQEEDVRKRLIDASAIAAQLAQLPILGGGLLQTEASAQVTETRLVKKLRRGEVGETAIQAARRTRRTWADYSARYRTPLPGEGDLLDDLTTRVLHEAGMAESECAEPNSAYGKKMLAILNERLLPERLGVFNQRNIDRLHLLGLVYQLTDECKIWWSPEFDLEEEASDEHADGR
ncbi:dsDNA nuclease domain-containing protein [Streptomyces griseorubiginosus]|uniref:dsDNA nuclease domain-containing protein n=1 Tax=Streptomyces griseorubiginosus TaxID=67304 RepID=UPI00362702EB